jgi:hypothetical protein
VTHTLLTNKPRHSAYLARLYLRIGADERSVWACNGKSGQCFHQLGELGTAKHPC